MNKKGVTLGLRTIVIGISLLVVLGLVLWMTSSRLRAAYEDITRAQNLSRAQLDMLKKAKAPEIKEMETEQEVMYQFLVDGAEFIKNGKYGDAVKKYILFYKECEKKLIETQKHIPSASEWTGYGCGAIKRDGIKFRILNALRGKYYKNPEQLLTLSDKNILLALIKPGEVESAVDLVKVTAYTISDKLDKAKENLEKPKVRLPLHIDGQYETVINDYFWAKRYGTFEKNSIQCEKAKEFNSQPLQYTNNFLKAFETSTGEWKDKVKFTVSNYKFLREPYDDIKSTCGAL